jgi:hypothetical protein
MKTVLVGLITAGLVFFLTAVSAQAIVALDPAAGYGITHDGNDGDFFSTVTGTPCRITRPWPPMAPLPSATPGWSRRTPSRT